MEKGSWEREGKGGGGRDTFTFAYRIRHRMSATVEYAAGSSSIQITS